MENDRYNRYDRAYELVSDIPWNRSAVIRYSGNITQDYASNMTEWVFRSTAGIIGWTQVNEYDRKLRIHTHCLFYAENPVVTEAKLRIESRDKCQVWTGPVDYPPQAISYCLKALKPENVVLIRPDPLASYTFDHGNSVEYLTL